MSESLLEVRDVYCHFDGPEGRFAAVDGVSLQIAAGEVVGLVGESGSGKSSLGKVITGLYSRTGGEVYFDGRPMPQRFRGGDFRYYADKIQMVFQDAYGCMNPRMRVGEACAEPLVIKGERAATARRQVGEWLERVGLSADMASRFPHELSGGQRQRAGIARAFITRPRLVICDEPVSALDVSVQAQVINLLRDLQREEGLAMLFIAHDLAVVRYLADRTVVMYRGRIMEKGDTAAVFASPVHPYTRTLLDANPLPDPRLERRRVRTSAGTALEKSAGIQGVGCPFAHRCFRAEPKCLEVEPPLEAIDRRRRAACHYPLLSRD